MNTSYKFSGNYTYNWEKSWINWNLNLDAENLNFRGDIIDLWSRFPNQKIEWGFERLESWLYIMRFLKFPPSSQLAGLLYELKQIEVWEWISGNYKWNWYALSERITVQTGDLVFSTLRVPITQWGEATEITIKS